MQQLTMGNPDYCQV